MPRGSTTPGSLREEQRALTRRKVLAAVVDLVAEGAMGDLNIPLVARRSGVSVATIYRYFPTKDALLDAAAEEPATRAGQSLPVEGTDARAYLRAMWNDFASNVALVRRQVASATGREMRDRRLAQSRAYLETQMRGAGVDPNTETGGRLVRVALLLTSSLAFLELHDRQGVPPDAAVDDVTWALTTLIDATRDGGTS